MSEGLNRCTILGNLGADPELRTTQSGQKILKLRVATTESYLDKSDVRQERTEWHSVTMFGPRGDGLSRLLHKGERIYVEGRLSTSSYEKDGEKRYRTEIVATNVLLCSGARGDAAPRQAARDPGAYVPRQTSQQGPAPLDPDDGDDGEIPF